MLYISKMRNLIYNNIVLISKWFLFMLNYIMQAKRIKNVAS